MDSSKKRLALGIAAVLLSAALVVLFFLIKDTRANMLFGDGADVQLGLSSVSVQLMENDKAIGEKDQLLSSLKDKDLEPGYTYDEKIGVKNNGDVSEYARVIVKKYWKDDKGKKITSMSPSLISLSYGKKAYNDKDWVENPKEATAEQSVYYHRLPIESGKATENLFDGIKLKPEIADKYRIIKSEDGKKLTAEYDYDGAHFTVEATVQSVQSADGANAVKAVWGSNVNAEYDVIVIE